MPWKSALLRRQIQQALLEQSIFTWDGVADLPVVLRMTTWSNACRLQHRQLQHSRAAFSGSGFCWLALQKDLHIRPEFGLKNVNSATP